MKVLAILSLFSAASAVSAFTPAFTGRPLSTGYDEDVVWRSRMTFGHSCVGVGTSGIALRHEPQKPCRSAQCAFLQGRLAVAPKSISIVSPSPFFVQWCFLTILQPAQISKVLVVHVGNEVHIGAGPSR